MTHLEELVQAENLRLLRKIAKDLNHALGLEPQISMTFDSLTYLKRQIIEALSLIV